jgi:hypothetical protein
MLANTILYCTAVIAIAFVSVDASPFMGKEAIFMLQKDAESSPRGFQMSPADAAFAGSISAKMFYNLDCSGSPCAAIEQTMGVCYVAADGSKTNYVSSCDSATGDLVTKVADCAAGTVSDTVLWNFPAAENNVCSDVPFGGFYGGVYSWTC